MEPTPSTRIHLLTVTLSGVLALALILQQFSLLNEEMDTYNATLDASMASAVTRGAKKLTELPLSPSQSPQESNRIIVKFKEGNLPPGLSVAAERANMEKAQGLTKLLTISGINADVYEVSDDDTASEVVDRIKATKKDVIEYAEVDMKVSPSFVPNDPYYPSMYQHIKMQSETAWDGGKGGGVTIAVLDTGANEHPDLPLVPGWNFWDNNSDVTHYSNHYHGTWVAGTAAAIGNNALGVAGPALNAKIMPLRITDLNGAGWWSLMGQAITYAADRGVRVANISYDGICSQSSAVLNAAQYMRSKGGVVVIAASNSGAQTTDMNTQRSEITCVSATDETDTRTSWSNFGPAVDVAAPGNYVWTTQVGGGYAQAIGTSFSAPLVAGVYALMFSVNPGLTPAQADNILFSTADDLGTPGWDMYYGYGRVNAAKAVAAAQAAVGTRDTVAPSVPQNLRTTSVTSNSISLAWNASTDDNSGVAGYDLYRNGTKIATVSGTTYTNSGLTSNTPYTYTVRATDSAGNVSAPSNEIAATTADISFGISGSSVTTKTTTSATIGVTLTKPGTVTVKYGKSTTALTSSAQSSTSGTSHSVSLTGLTAKTTYYYQVVATDATGQTVTGPISSFKTAAGGGKR